MTFTNAIDLSHIATQLESGNSRDRMLALAALRHASPTEAFPLIQKVLNDDNLQVRSMAVFALGIKPTEGSYPILTKLLETDPDYGIRADAAGALGYLEDDRGFSPLVRAFYEDTHWLVRFSAAVSLGNLKNPEAREVLLKALECEEVVLQQAAIAGLGEIGAVEALPQLLRFVSSDDWLLRMRLADALGNLNDPQSISALKYLVKDSNPQVAEAAQFSLDRLNIS